MLGEGKNTEQQNPRQNLLAFCECGFFAAFEKLAAAATMTNGRSFFPAPKPVNSISQSLTTTCPHSHH